jgi:hypothetical protein
MMVLFTLPCRGLMAVEAVDARSGMQAHLVFVDDRILSARVTLGAFSARTNRHLAWHEMSDQYCNRRSG